jgi:hypothetical protein
MSMSYKTLRHSKEASFSAPEEASTGVIHPWAGLKIFQKAQEPIFLAEVFHLFCI